MRKLGLLGTSALGSTAFIGLFVAFAAPASAQTTEPDPPATLQEEVELESGQDVADDSEAPAAEGAIVVTGTRIRSPNLVSDVPITSVGIQDLTDTGDVSLGDALNDLPSLRSTFSQGNSTRFIGTAGLNVLDLRGLGTSRTLVLVNNRRHVTASPGDSIVDINTIPTDLIERVDIVTGGNSAIYGSDAVAGVVNFVLKRDFEGIRLRAQGGVSEEGDRGSYFVSGIWGQNFADGRGNVTVAAEYSKSNPLYFRDRDSLTGAFSGRRQFQATDDPRNEPGGSDGIPDSEFLSGVRNGSISDGGTVGFIANDGTALRFDTNGNLVADTPERGFLPISGNVIGGFGSTLRNTGQLAAGLQRYSVNLLTRFEVSPAFQPFLEAKYVHIDAIQEGQPSFFFGSIPNFFGGGSNFSCDNPFLNTQARGALTNVVSSCARRTAAIPANPATGAPAVPSGIALDANGNRIFDPTRTFTFSRFNVDFGGRGELHDRDTYRVVGGIEGDFNEDWRYEVAVNYGRLETRLRSLNNLQLFDLEGNEAGFLLAIDAVRNSSGQIVCRVNADSNPANDNPACVPLNVFGEGAPSQAALDFVNTTAMREGKAEQFVATAFVSGDMSQLFELPGGPIGFALGAEYRKETSFEAFDELTASGGTFLNAIQPFDPPSFEVKEAFGELRVPLLRDLPLVRELTLSAAGRVSDYKGATGTVFAYNLGLTYSPVEDLRFRANYSTSVRAPTQSDLFSPQSQNFNQLTDPCDTLSIGNNPNRQANCAAFGVPLAATPQLSTLCESTPFPVAPGAPFVNCLARSASTGFTSGGNPNLTEEEGKSYTIGAIFTPSFLRGFSLTVDYYNIEVESLISTLGAQTILNQCFDDPGGIDNPFCASIRRDPATGLFVEPALLSSGINFARQETEGIDVDVAYRHRFDNGHTLNLRAIGTYLIKLNNFTDPTDPDNPNRQKSELGDPEYAANLNANYDFGVFDIGYNLRYIGRQVIGTFESRFAFNGEPPTNEDSTPGKFYPDVFYHDVQLGFDVAEDFRFHVGVDNVGNRKPPLGLLGVAGGDPFDSIGRFFYAGARVDF